MRPEHRAENDDLLAIIDQELDRLPASFRDAVILCDLEGRSYAEAARRLHCPLGTLQSRLARGRARLRSRLICRGVAPIALASFLAEGASAAVPEALAAATVRSAIATAIGESAMAGAVSATVAALAGSVARSMLMSIMQRGALAFAAVSIAIDAGLLASDARSGTQAPAPAPPVIQPQPAEPPKPGQTVKLTVVTKADGSPLAGATVWLCATRGRLHTWEGRTDDQGNYVIALPGAETHSIAITVASAGYVPVWLRSSTFLASHVLSLVRAEPIGGIAQDEQGRPIEGARVLTSPYRSGPPWPEIYASPNSERAIATTDAQGRWQSNSLPADAPPDAPVWVLVMHPDHVTAQWRTTAAKARAFSSVQVMKSGLSVSGTVLSPFGRPVPEATVVIGMPPWDGMFLRLATDKNGQFRTGRCLNPNWPESVLTVRAAGLALVAREILLTPEIPPQVIKLTRRRPITGRVVDAQGRPVVGAVVSSSRRAFNGLLGWEADTDANGRFQWYDAPTEGTIHLDVSKLSFWRVDRRPVDPGAGEVLITLHRPQHLHGTVIDAETGRPIERFSLIRGWGPPLPFMRPEWMRDRENTRSFTEGCFDWTNYQAPTRTAPARSGSRPRATCPASSSGSPVASRTSSMISSSAGHRTGERSRAWSTDPMADRWPAPRSSWAISTTPSGCRAAGSSPRTSRVNGSRRPSPRR